MIGIPNAGHLSMIHSWLLVSSFPAVSQAEPPSGIVYSHDCALIISGRWLVYIQQLEVVLQNYFQGSPQGVFFLVFKA